VIKNRRSSRIWKIVGGVLLGWLLFWLVSVILAISAFSVLRVENVETGQVIEEHYEPDDSAATHTLPLP